MHGGFTLIELLATLAIVAALLAMAVPMIGNYVATAQRTADTRTLAVLNDALTRYKTEGGDINALTLGAPAGNIINKLTAPIVWNGLSHEVLNRAFTYPAKSLEALGNGKRYRFIRANASTSTSTTDATDVTNAAASEMEVTTWAGNGTGGTVPATLGASCTLTEARFVGSGTIGPLFCASDGTIYFANATRLLKISGNTVTYFATVLNGIHQINQDSSGNLYLVSNSGKRVIKIPPSGGTYNSSWDWAGTGTNASDGDGGDKLAASFSNPAGICFDPSGNAYVSDFGGSYLYKIRKIATNGIVSTLTVTMLDYTPQLQYSSTTGKIICRGNTIGSGSSSLASIDPTTGVITNLASGIPTYDEVYTLDSSGNIWVRCYQANVIVRVPPAGGAYDDSWRMAGQNGVSGNVDGDARTTALFSTPAGICVAKDGSVLVFQSGTPAIRKISKK